MTKETSIPNIPKYPKFNIINSFASVGLVCNKAVDVDSVTGYL